MRKSKKKTILWLNVSRITSNKNLWMVVKLTFPPKIVGINRLPFKVFCEKRKHFEN